MYPRQFSRNTRSLARLSSPAAPSCTQPIKATPSHDIQKESLWIKIQEELFGYTGYDTGHWALSPEWYGSQGGGWGRDDGAVVFSKLSSLNGLIEVTAHHASPLSKSKDALMSCQTREEWRVLRFNKVTRQSVSRVSIDESKGSLIEANPECLASEYLKTIASVVAALIGIHSLAAHHHQSSPIRILCIGVGGGSLPLFLSHHYNAHVDAVEIDPVVVEAASTCMGLPTEISSNSSIRVITQDAVDYLKICVDDVIDVGYRGLVYDIIVIDAFDGSDDVPEVVFDENFARMIAQVAHPTHGSVIMNLHHVDEVHRPCALYRGALSCRGSDAVKGDARADVQSFCVSATKQRNVALVCSRFRDGDGDSRVLLSKEVLREAAMGIAGRYAYQFAAGSRACRDFQVL